MIKIIRTLNLNRETTAILENAYAISYEKQVNAIWQASFSLPINDPKVNKVELLKYVEIENVGLFRIMPKLTNKSSNSVTFQCEHVLSTLLDACLFKYHQLSNYTTRQVIEYLLNQQEIKHWELRRCDFNRGFHYSWENENGLVGPLFSIPKPFDEPYMWQFDTSTYPWQLDLIRPDDIPTCRIKEGYNLVDFEIEENPMNVINRIYPIGAGEGVNQLTIESVNNGIPYLEDLQPGDEIIKHIWVDRRFTNAEHLKASAQALLDEWKKPKVSWSVKGADVSLITGLSVDKFKVGNIIRLDIKGYPLTEVRIMKESKHDLTGDPGNVELQLGNVVDDLGTTQADLERRQQINELYSQGATNILNFTYQDNCDSKIPAVIPFYIDDDVVNVNTIELTFRTKAFRAYSQTTESGGQVIKTDTTGGGGSTVKASTTGGGGGVVKSTTTETGGESTQTSSPYNKSEQISVESGLNIELANGYHHHKTPIPLSMFQHTHSVSVPAHKHNLSIDLPNHTHPFEFTLGNHTHPITINIPSHEHPIKHGIYELSTLPNKVTIKVDGNIVPHTAITGDRINLVDYLSKDSSGRVTRGRHEVEILPNERGRIEADLILRVFIQSQLGGNF